MLLTGVGVILFDRLGDKKGTDIIARCQLSLLILSISLQFRNIEIDRSTRSIGFVCGITSNTAIFNSHTPFSSGIQSTTECPMTLCTFENTWSLQSQNIKLPQLNIF